VPGRKRGLAVDVLGLVIAVVMLAASAHDNTAGIALLDRVAAGTEGTVTKALADQGFKNAVVAHGAGLGIDVEIIERNPTDNGFVPQPKRWVVEQTYGILMFHRRLVRDYEHLPASSESRVYWAMTDVMSRQSWFAGVAGPSPGCPPCLLSPGAPLCWPCTPAMDLGLGNTELLRARHAVPAHRPGRATRCAVARTCSSR
jgi:transposase